jgi:kynurenine 3-monooxygenase
MNGNLKLLTVLLLQVAMCSLAFPSTTSGLFRSEGPPTKGQHDGDTATKRIVIAGAGPTGLLLAHFLVRRPGYQIVVIEKRSDPRVAALSDPRMMRSFPIALDGRGLSSLEAVPGLKEAVEEEGVYLSGICLHNLKSYKPRIIKRDKPSLSVDRNRLALTLLTELVATAPAAGTALSIQFGSAMRDVNIEEGWISVDATESENGAATSRATIPFDHLVAADGGYSTVRRQLVETGMLDSTEQEIPDDYRAIFLALQSEDGTVTLDRDKLHGWMFPGRDGARLISAPVVAECVSGAFIFNKGRDPFVGMT